MSDKRKVRYAQLHQAVSLPYVGDFTRNLDPYNPQNKFHGKYTMYLSAAGIEIAGEWKEYKFVALIPATNIVVALFDES